VRTDPHGRSLSIAGPMTRGYAISDEELALAIRALAVPVVGSHNEIIAAISVSAFRTRVSLICDGAFFASFRLVRECMLKRPQIAEALDVGYLTKPLPGGPSYSLLHSLTLKLGLHRGDT
jgi:Bacterial transcriptional regulator